MKLELLAFGITKDILGSHNKAIDIPDGSSVQELKNLLETDYPEMTKLTSYFIAIDNEYAQNDQLLTSAQEIAIIPPVSGG